MWDGPDDALERYGQLLARAAPALCRDPYGQLRATVGLARQALASAGPRLAQDAAWLGRRDDYLGDAAELLRDGVARLETALAAPDESDLSIRVACVRENVRYFADVTADLVPAAVYLDVGRDLLPELEAAHDAPRLRLELLPLLETVLGWLGEACRLAMVLTARADALLVESVPGGEVGVAPHQGLHDVHRGEIARLIVALRRERPELESRGPQDDEAHARAVRDALDLTPRQLYAVIDRFTGIK